MTVRELIVHLESLTDHQDAVVVEESHGEHSILGSIYALDQIFNAGSGEVENGKFICFGEWA